MAQRSTRKTRHKAKSRRFAGHPPAPKSSAGKANGSGATAKQPTASASLNAGKAEKQPPGLSAKKTSAATARPKTSASDPNGGKPGPRQTRGSKRQSKSVPAKPSSSPSSRASTRGQSATSHSPARRQADQYNDPAHNYRDYWQGRDYEQAAEELAIARLLGKRHFDHAVDVGGGYGRLCLLLKTYADHVTLAEPSQQQLDLAKDFLRGRKDIDRQLLQAADLKFPDGSIDLITTIRIWHHLPDPTAELREIARVLSSDGYFVMEFANYTHFRNRLKHIAGGKKFPPQPVDIRSPKNRNASELPFVNHNPRTLIKQLGDAGLEVRGTLSVSNLRSPGLKKIMPQSIMLSLEKNLQKPLAGSYFGPSIFFLVRKKRT